MSLNYREETELEAMVAWGVPAPLAERYLADLHAKLDQVGAEVERFRGWRQDELMGFFGRGAGWAAAVLLYR